MKVIELKELNVKDIVSKIKEHDLERYAYGVYYSGEQQFVSEFKHELKLNNVKSKVIFKDLNKEDLIIGYEHADCLIVSKNISQSTYERIQGRNRMLKSNKEENSITII